MKLVRLAALLVLLLAVGGCGSDDESSPSGTTAAETTAAPTGTGGILRPPTAPIFVWPSNGFATTCFAARNPTR